MTQIFIDKISSITKNLELDHVEHIIDDPQYSIPCDMGTVIAAEVLEDKTIYNELELTSGRMSKLKKGDIIAVALGERMALKGFVGKRPDVLHPNDIIHLLNMGGVAGECTSSNKNEVGSPLRIRVLGGVARNEKQLNINQKTLFSPKKTMDSTVPLIIVTGTSMDSGKTTVAVEMIKSLSRIGMKLAGAKLTGVGAMRDVFKMQDYGVRKAVTFVDAGVTSTANIGADMVGEVARGALDYLSQDKPDAIMVEFGDGLMGRYGLQHILKIPEIQRNVRLHIGCAGDPISALGLAKICSDIGLPLDLISGPVTDNEVGKAIIDEHIPNTMTYNAFNPTTEWMDLVISRWLHAYQLSA